MQFPAAAGVACQEVRNSSFELSATGHMPGQSLPRQPRRSRWLQCMIVFSIRRRTGLKPMVAKQRISSQSKLCRELPGTIWSGLSQGDAPKVPEKPQPHPTVTSAAELNRTASRALTSWCQGWLRLRKMRRALPGRITHPIALWRREKAVMLMPEDGSIGIVLFVVGAGRVWVLVWYHAVVVSANTLPKTLVRKQRHFRKKKTKAWPLMSKFSEACQQLSEVAAKVAASPMNNTTGSCTVAPLRK